MKNLKLVLGVQLMLVVLFLLDASIQGATAEGQQQDLHEVQLDDIELFKQMPVPKSQKALDSLAAAVFDEWVTEGRDKKSKERSFRQMKPTLRFGRRSDPRWAPIEGAKLEQSDRGLAWVELDGAYNLV